MKQRTRLFDLLTRPQLGYADLEPLFEQREAWRAEAGDLAEEAIEQVEIQVKYEGYLERERDLASRMSRLDHVPLDMDLDYLKLNSLSMEARQKLDRVRPTTLGQASRISGVSPADISVLLVYMGR